MESAEGSGASILREGHDFEACDGEGSPHRMEVK